jgi:hypothetical protein
VSPSFFQQPGGIEPTLVEPVTAPELLVVEPAHDGIEPLDIGTVINGLTPGLSISVEPSGIVPPFNVKLELVPIVESGEAVPVDVAVLTDAPSDAQTELVVEPNPPPSKVEPMVDVGPRPDALDPIMPEDIPELAAKPLVLQFESGAGLRPPGSISVAPSGIPVGLFDPLGVLEPGTPSGDVAPMPPLVITLCAWAAPPPNMIAATTRGKSLMEHFPCWG